MKSILLLTLLLVASTLSYSRELPKESLSLLQAAFPQADFSQTKWTIGDLNGDGLEDLAILVFHPVHSEELGRPVEMERLVVMLRTKETYQIAVQSLDWEDHERRGDSIGIAKGVLVLSMEGASSCCSHYLHQLKFKLRDGVFLLIGEELFESEHLVDGKEYSSGTSINYLTRQVIHSWRAGKKTAPEVKRRFAGEPLQLSNFSYYTYRDQFNSKELNWP